MIAPGSGYRSLKAALKAKPHDVASELQDDAGIRRTCRGVEASALREAGLEIVGSDAEGKVRIFETIGASVLHRHPLRTASTFHSRRSPPTGGGIRSCRVRSSRDEDARVAISDRPSATPAARPVADSTLKDAGTAARERPTNAARTNGDFARILPEESENSVTLLRRKSLKV